MAWEIFAGCGRWTDAIQRKGLGVLHPLDIRHGEDHDVLDFTILRIFLAGLRGGYVLMLHLAPPCTIFHLR